MSISDFASKVAGDVLGNPKKAVLLLYQPPAKNAAAGKVSNLAAAALTGGSGGQAGGGGVGTSKRLEVQYNPASLSLQANAEPIPFSYLLKNVDNGVPNQQIRPPAIALSVELVFDDTNLKDAFMAEKFRLSVGDAVTAGAGIVQSARGGYTVQPQTNALVAMLMRDATRLVTFQWADLSFTGEVCQVQAKYTMFSVSGKPIRSTVQLVILQRIATRAGFAYWDKAFDACFSDRLGGSGGSKSAVEKAGNLINVTGF